MLTAAEADENNQFEKVRLSTIKTLLSNTQQESEAKLTHIKTNLYKMQQVEETYELKEKQKLERAKSILDDRNLDNASKLQQLEQDTSNLHSIEENLELNETNARIQTLLKENENIKSDQADEQALRAEIARLKNI